MADGPKVGPQGLQASLTASLGGIATATCLKWIPPEDAQYWVAVASVVVPVIGYVVARFVASFDEPAGLTRYKTRLKRDLKSQKKILNDKNISNAIKNGVKRKYEETMIALSTANQDFKEEGIVLDDRQS